MSKSFTGANYPPPLGFDQPAALWFSPLAEFPCASTCALELTLPTKYHDSPDMFKEKMILCFAEPWRIWIALDTYTLFM